MVFKKKLELAVINKIKYPPKSGQNSLITQFYKSFHYFPPSPHLFTFPCILHLVICMLLHAIFFPQGKTHLVVSILFIFFSSPFPLWFFNSFLCFLDLIFPSLLFSFGPTFLPWVNNFLLFLSCFFTSQVKTLPWRILRDLMELQVVNYAFYWDFVNFLPLPLPTLFDILF